MTKKEINDWVKSKNGALISGPNKRVPGSYYCVIKVDEQEGRGESSDEEVAIKKAFAAILTLLSDFDPTAKS